MFGVAGKVVMEPFTGIGFEQQKQIDNTDYHLHATAVRCMLGQVLLLPSPERSILELWFEIILFFLVYVQMRGSFVLQIDDCTMILSTFYNTRLLIWGYNRIG
jgi:hypothetical protein